MWLPGGSLAGGVSWRCGTLEPTASVRYRELKEPGDEPMPEDSMTAADQNCTCCRPNKSLRFYFGNPGPTGQLSLSLLIDSKAAFKELLQYLAPAVQQISFSLSATVAKNPVFTQL
ncbi:hypothetical protein Y1Q_0016856 [Alligator mississippiensis]|uniref:Uncharacterized protein n=1 Tax=Alligator mississippiensis TaxID=8496 RepID=A0A151P6P7_ALLMI|nr:hypothetical protein Y1Q_0016856 [Alligator mississippiensis]